MYMLDSTLENTMTLSSHVGINIEHVASSKAHHALDNAILPSACLDCLCKFHR